MVVQVAEHEPDGVTRRERSDESHVISFDVMDDEYACMLGAGRPASLTQSHTLTDETIQRLLVSRRGAAALACEHHQSVGWVVRAYQKTASKVCFQPHSVDS